MKSLLSLVGVLALAHFSVATRKYYSPIAVETNNGRCLTEEQAETERARISTNISALLQEPVMTPCGPGWTRVAFLNMSDPTEQCPSAWLHDDTTEIDGCTRQRTTSSSCDSVSYPTGVEYSQVCGRVIGHQFGSTDAFSQSSQRSIDEPYMDGVSLTHGSPRQHIWTFSSGYTENYSTRQVICPCNSLSTAQTPAYIGDNYFCETGFDSGFASGYGNDPLWDGEGCTVSECCSFNSPPLLTVSLPAPTTDDIEVRICCDETDQYENVYIELLELYVK